MSEFQHIPVLEEAVISLLAPRAGGVYVDGTLGGGGHAHHILVKSGPNGRLIGIDRDPTAVEAASARLAEFGDRTSIVQARYTEMEATLSRLGIDRVDGILLDLGVSSPQLDRGERGFSFNKPGPLDMRMDPTQGETALELMKRLPPDELASVLRELGDERYSKRIAGHIKEALREGVLQSTLDLAQLVDEAVPGPAKRKLKVHAATKTFQALRIAVNRELEQLEEFLALFPRLLADGGRCVVISFHSLEDRQVKRAFRALTWSSSLPPDLAVKAGERVHPVCRLVTRKPVFATDEEVAANPRSRSARVRACEKLAIPSP